MKWGDISDIGRAWMRDLGNFGPTVNTRDRMVKGCMFDDDGEAARTYLDSADLRGLAAACNEVADWLDARAGGWIEWKGGECPIKAGEKFEVRLANGSECIGGVSPEWCWSHDAPFCERIIAYRVVTPAEQMSNRLEAFSLGMDRAAIDCAIRAAEELTTQRDELLVVLRDLELGANTVVACYDRNPGNFAVALSDLKRYATAARAVVAKATGGAS